MFISGLLHIFTVPNLLCLFLGCIVGLVIGLLPGLGPMFGIALFLPLTFSMSIDTSLILLTSIYAASAYSDGITSILLGIPVGPAGVAIAFDGFPLTTQGKAGLALGALAGAAIVGDMIGVTALVTLSPVLSAFAMKIGPAEYFMLTMFGLSMVSMMGKGAAQAIKGLLLACFGLMVSFIGRDVITGEARYTFGIRYLENGVPFIAACIGLFALSRVFILAEEGGSIAGERPMVTKPWKGIFMAFKYWYVTIRSALVGVFLSMLPGIGITSAALLSYFGEQRLSKDPDSYGKGNVRGVIAAQAATNATTGGELIPVLSLGIPSGAPSAIFMAALTLHGLRPGLDFWSSAGDKAYTIFGGMFLAAIIFFVIGTTCTPIFSKVTKIPNALLVPTITVLCFVGTFALNGQVGDMVVCFIFGIFGYALHKFKWPIPSIVLGLILGSLAESNFQRALRISDGWYGVFLSSPFCIVIFLIIVTMLVLTYIVTPLQDARKLRKKSA